ncbi:hypothetical protein ACVQ8P_03330 [Dellaglioa sp. BT-FLS60]
MFVTAKMVSADILYGYSTLPTTVNSHVEEGESGYHIYSDSNNMKSPYLQIVATDGLTPSWQLRGRLKAKSNDIVHVDLFCPELQAGLKNIPETYGNLISGDSINLSTNAKDSSGEYLFYWPNTLVQILTTDVVAHAEMQMVWIIQMAATK